jgi:hypothetical protein
VDELEGEVVGEEIHEGALGDDIFSAYEDGADVSLFSIFSKTSYNVLVFSMLWY